MTTPAAPELPTAPTETADLAEPTDLAAEGLAESDRGGRFWPMALAIVVAIGLGAGLGLVVWRKSHPATAPIAVKGVVLLSSANRVDAQANGECAGGTGYSDVRAGAVITVAGSTGATIATGTLEAGHLQESAICVFPFALSVPSGQRTYRVGLNDRGAVTVSEADLGNPDHLVLLIQRSGAPALATE